MRIADPHRSFHPPASDIDRSSTLSTYGSARRPSISTGVPRYRPMAPPADSRYRPELGVIDLRLQPADLGYRPELGVIDLRLQPADLGYRAELGVIGLRLRPPAPDIDGNSELSTGAVERHELLRSWETPTFTHWCSLIGGLLPVGEPRYRPDLPPPIGDVNGNRKLLIFGN